MLCIKKRSIGTKLAPKATEKFNALKKSTDKFRKTRKNKKHKNNTQKKEKQSTLLPPLRLPGYVLEMPRESCDKFIFAPDVTQPAPFREE